ncbi:hypothetical protein PCO86_03115 [Pectobacteriaceae bacterium CE70]|nr:hypothetical protein PCO87_03195 [Pectobacteriaceae bacterium C52]WJV67454.1 hypothetical protein PCO86_03115 [Pectobacteriaceae bacterium CE70]WJY11437.1 hypothetical protein PCO80_03125 [Pectobacteriaceae bacterium C80]
MIDYSTATKNQLKQEFLSLIRVISDMPFGTKKEFFHLPNILNVGEQPLAVASGMMNGNTWLVDEREGELV